MDIFTVILNGIAVVLLFACVALVGGLIFVIYQLKKAQDAFWAIRNTERSGQENKHDDKY